jgi:aspartate/methionine/tyrosine aminotransferase
LLQGHPRLVKSIASLFSKLHGRDIQPLSEVAKLAGSITFDNPIKFTLIYIFMLQVLITNGAYESLYCAISAFVNEGDEVMQQLNYLR